jgi:hypothetical protein
MVGEKKMKMKIFLKRRRRNEFPGEDFQKKCRCEDEAKKMMIN